jgi:hypothetical protein
MLTRTNIARAIVAIAALVATWAMPGTTLAQRQAVPKPQDKLALGEPEVKQLLLLIDTDKSGRISKDVGSKLRSDTMIRDFAYVSAMIGRGMDANVLEEGGRAGHWGLAGIRERAQQIGARLDFLSENGRGTEIQLTVPAASAYEKLGDTTGSRLFRGRRKHEPRS